MRRSEKRRQQKKVSRRKKILRQVNFGGEKARQGKFDLLRRGFLRSKKRKVQPIEGLDFKS